MPPTYSSPSLRGTKAAAAAAVIWTIISKAGWLPIWEHYLPVRSGFFRDPDIVAYCMIGLTWLVRELREACDDLARAIKRLTG